jgi:arsenate reductase-like glutaredoxin family protein
LRELGATPSERDFGKKPFTVEELQRLFGDRPLEPFLNTRHEVYRARVMKSGLPARDELLRLIAENPNLMRRPLLVAREEIVVGFNEAAYREIASR